MKLIAGSDDLDKIKNDRNIFPNLMDDDLAARVPKVVIMGMEFDHYLYATNEAA